MHKLAFALLLVARCFAGKIAPAAASPVVWCSPCSDGPFAAGAAASPRRIALLSQAPSQWLQSPRQPTAAGVTGQETSLPFATGGVKPLVCRLLRSDLAAAREPRRPSH